MVFLFRMVVIEHRATVGVAHYQQVFGEQCLIEVEEVNHLLYILSMGPYSQHLVGVVHLEESIAKHVQRISVFALVRRSQLPFGANTPIPFME